MIKHTIVGILIYLLAPCMLYGLFPINIFRPWDPFLRPPVWQGENWQITTFFEHGYKSEARNPDSDRVDVMKIWSPTQSSIAMLQGFPPGSDITRFYDELGRPADDGLRGHFDVTGKFDLNANAVFAVRYHFPFDITFGFYLPVISASLQDIDFKDLTPPDSPENILIIEELTSQLQRRVHEFAPTYNLDGWKRTGVGDLALIGEWIPHFKQKKSMLKDVMVNARFGALIPTGVAANADDIFSIPFGCNGSFGLIFGGALGLTWWDVVTAGLDVEFWQLFGNTRDNRIKIVEQQTEFLLLAKQLAHTDPGFVKRFHLWLEANNLAKGLTLGTALQFWQGSEGTLSLCSNDFSQDVANTAEPLQDWSMHHALFKVGYDFQQVISERSFFKPQVYFFYKLPINGKRAIMLHTFGAAFTLNF